MKNKMTQRSFSEKNTGSKFSDLKAGHVAIRTTQYDAFIKWYKETLDFRLLHEWTAGEMQLAFLAPPNDDYFIIEILGNKNTEPATTSNAKSGYDHLCFHVEDLDTTIQELKNRNVTIHRSFTVDAIGKRVAFIADPFGNVIEFCEDIK